MKKLLVVGVIVLFLGLAIAPSIPAIQQKTIEDRAYNDFFSRIENIDFNDLKSIIEGIPDHPILFIWVMFTFYFRLLRAELYMDMSCEIDSDLHFIIHNPPLFFWSVILLYSTVIMSFFWWDLAEKMEWNWNEFI